MSAQPPVALTIAGSDSGGGAGIQADLKTFAAHRVFGVSAVTAVTAQNTRAVEAVHPLPARAVVQQVHAVLGDLPVAAVKTGMLGAADVVRAVGELAAAGVLPRLVVDPVMVASSGDRLLDPEAERVYRERLLPHTEVLTPNVHEAEALLGWSVPDLPAQHEAARALGALGPRCVVLKGGHVLAGTAGRAVDVVWDGGTTYELQTPRVDTRNHHGTGCTFSAAVTAGLAQGLALADALVRAKGYVRRALVSAAHWRLGSGHGPLDHAVAPVPDPDRAGAR